MSLPIQCSGTPCLYRFQAPFAECVNKVTWDLYGLRNNEMGAHLMNRLNEENARPAVAYGVERDKWEPI